MRVKDFLLDEIFEFLPKSKHKAGEGLRVGKYPFFSSSQRQSKWFDEADYKKEAIILGTGGMPSVHCAKDFSASTDVFVMSPRKNEILTKYVYYFFVCRKDILEKGFKGAGLKHLSREYTKKIQIPFPVDKNGNPDLAEQKRIVAILEEADGLRKKRAEADHKTEGVILALFFEMFGDINLNSKNWPVVRFSEIGNARLGKMLDAKKQTNQNKKPYLRNVNVQWGRIDVHDLLEMDFSEKEQKELRLQCGDLLICEGGAVGRAAIWKNQTEECYFQKALHRVRIHEGVATPEFILFFLKSNSIRNGFSGYISGTATIPHLTGVKLASIPVPLPPIKLQKKFSEMVKEIEILQERQNQSTKKINTLFQGILAGVSTRNK